MAGAYYRLQDTIHVSSSSTQRLEDAIDVLGWGTIVVNLRIPSTSGGSITLQHAAVLEEGAFEDSSLTFTASSPGSQIGTLTNPLRYLRWRVASGTGVHFVLDVIARDN